MAEFERGRRDQLFQGKRGRLPACPVYKIFKAALALFYGTIYQKETFAAAFLRLSWSSLLPWSFFCLYPYFSALTTLWIHPRNSLSQQGHMQKDIGENLIQPIIYFYKMAESEAERLTPVFLLVFFLNINLAPSPWDSDAAGSIFKSCLSLCFSCWYVLWK